MCKMILVLWPETLTKATESYLKYCLHRKSIKVLRILFGISVGTAAASNRRLPYLYTPGTYTHLERYDQLNDPYIVSSNAQSCGDDKLN